MIWLFILLSFLLLVCYILIAPFYLEIDSRNGLCRFRFHRLASARLYIMENTLLMDIKITWWTKTIDLFKPQKRIEKKVAAEKKKKEKKKISFKKIWAVIMSFNVNKCIINIDTGNMPLNGILYPSFLLLSDKTGKNILINFEGENEIVFETENNIARMLWVFVKS